MNKWIKIVRMVAAAGLAIVAGSCGTGDLPTGASGGRHVALSVNPVFQAQGGSTGVVDVAVVRILIVRTDGTVALDTTINFPGGVDEFAVPLTVPLSLSAPPSGEDMQLTLELFNAAGELVFRGGPTTVRARQGTPLPPVNVPIQYVGTGSEAVRVAIEPVAVTLEPGASTVLVATAFDASNTPLAGTPVQWSSGAPDVAQVPNPATGQVVAGAGRGTATITARLLTGQTATAVVTVRPLPVAIALVSGDAQSCVVGRALDAPLVVRVTSANGTGVDQTTVAFNVISGGGALASASVVTGADGSASTTYTPSGVPGPVVIHATAEGLAGSPVVFTFSCAAGDPAQLVFVTEPTDGISGAVMAPFTVEVRDSFGNRLTSAAGAIAVALDEERQGVALSGTQSVAIAEGQATFNGLVITGVSAGLRLRATMGGTVAPGVSTAFDVTAVPTAIVRVSGDAQPCTVGAVLGAPLVVRVTDATTAGVAQVAVGFSIVSGGGTLASASVMTGADGTASTTFTAGTVPGPVEIRATVNGLEGSPVVFTFSCAAGAPAQLAFTTQPASGTSGAALAPFTVEVRDSFGNRVMSAAGTISVALETVQPGVVLSGTQSAAIVDGRATINGLVVTGVATGLQLRATMSGEVTPATSTPFDVAALPPVDILIVSGNGQAGDPHAELNEPLVVRVVNALGVGVPGVAVEWRVDEGGGNADPDQSVTDANGLTSTRWQIGAAGPQRLTAVSAVGSVEFEADVLSAATSTIEGTVIDSRNGNPLPGATVVLRDGNSVEIGTTQTNTLGQFVFTPVEAGSYQVTVSNEGFIEVTQPVSVGPDASATVNFALSAVQDEGTVTIVLTWGALPTDLDSHLFGPGGVHIYYGNVANCQSPPFACLDLDDTNGFGPETMTITQVGVGDWTYAVHRFSANGTFAESPASVQVYLGNTLVRTYAPPSGSQAWWTVFRINGTTITDVNTVGSTVETGTAALRVAMPPLPQKGGPR